MVTIISEHAATPMLTAACRVHGFVRDTALCDSPFASLQVGATHVVPSGLYGCQVRSSIKLNVSKITPGVKRSSPNWAVLHECEHNHLQSS